MFDRYSQFVQQFRHWYDRMNPREFPHYDRAPLMLMSLQTLNVFLLVLALAPDALGDGWVFTGVFFGSGALLYAGNAYFFARCQRASASLVSWLSPVPALSEFPAVYGYLGLTVVQVMLTMAMRIPD